MAGYYFSVKLEKIKLAARKKCAAVKERGTTMLYLEERKLVPFKFRPLDSFLPSVHI
jgi:hypothetical protein